MPNNAEVTMKGASVIKIYFSKFGFKYKNCSTKPNDRGGAGGRRAGDERGISVFKFLAKIS